MTHAEWLAHAKACELQKAALTRTWMVAERVQMDCVISHHLSDGEGSKTFASFKVWRYGHGTVSADELDAQTLVNIARYRSLVEAWVEGARGAGLPPTEKNRS